MLFRKEVYKEGMLSKLSRAVRWMSVGLFASVCLLASLSVLADTTQGNPSTAQEGAGKLLEKVGKPAYNASGNAPDLTKAIVNVITVFLGVLGVVFVVLIIYAGFLWMNARGNPDDVKQAQELMRQAVVGLGIIIAAQIITFWVVARLGEAIGRSQL